VGLALHHAGTFATAEDSAEFESFFSVIFNIKVMCLLTHVGGAIF